MSRAPQRLVEVKPLSFVYAAESPLPRDVCVEAIRRFEANASQQYPGRIGQDAQPAPEVKRSTDLFISGREDWKDLDRILAQHLGGALRELAREFPFFAANAFKDEGYNLQRSGPGDFYHWHVDSGPGAFTQRQLVAIWYLNDVPGPGGETEFFLQGIGVRPTQGKLILFPPFWTHIHRGVTLREGVKYIATTWLRFA